MTAATQQPLGNIAHINDPVDQLIRARIEPGQKVWPLKVRIEADRRHIVARIWCVKPVILTRSVTIEKFARMDAKDPKFSRFVELYLNQPERHHYVMGHFTEARHDPADPRDVHTVGFVFNIRRSGPLAPALTWKEELTLSRHRPAVTAP